MTFSRFLPPLLIGFALLVAGCQDPAATTNNGGNGGHDHDHEHHHHHAMGPNGGHVLKLADSGFQAEWIHDDEAGIITVHILDAGNKPALAYSADFETTVGGNKKKYLLELVEPNSDGMASQFTLTNPELVTTLGMAEQSHEAAKAELIAGLANGEVRAQIEVHDHDH